MAEKIKADSNTTSRATSKINSKTQMPTKKHAHQHTHTETKKVQNRLARAAGHLEYVRRMVDEGEDCTEVLMQLAAVKSALNNTAKIILKDHIDHCIAHAIEDGDNKAIEDLNKAIERYMD